MRQAFGIAGIKGSAFERLDQIFDRRKGVLDEGHRNRLRPGFHEEAGFEAVGRLRHAELGCGSGIETVVGDLYLGAGFLLRFRIDGEGFDAPAIDRDLDCFT